MKIASYEGGQYEGLSCDEYNISFGTDLTPEAFTKIMGSPITWREADEIILVDPETKEQARFRRVKEGEWTTRRTIDHDGDWWCTACGAEVTIYMGEFRDDRYAYCPHCGAVMKNGPLRASAPTKK